MREAPEKPWMPSGARSLPAPEGGRSRRLTRPQRLRRTLTGCAALVVGAALFLGVGGRGGHARPTPTVRITLPASTAVAPQPASPPALPWPASGQAAVAIPRVGYREQSGAEGPVPVASLAKIMTAYVVLRDHPIAPGGVGPSVALTAADVAQFGVDTVTDQANVELVAGEVLTEYQMLEGLLVHSANDLAYALAAWDAGSVGAFVAKMNAVASALGMRSTHFADASGFAAASKSTAADMLDVTAAAMSDPVFARIVTMQSVTLPFAGTVSTYTPMLGTPGVVGVKSGFTTAAGGCDVLAYRTTVGGQPITVLAAVTSQEGPTVLERTGQAALALAKAAVARVVSVTVAPARRVVGVVEVAGRAARAVLAAPASVLAVAGQTVRERVRVARLPPGALRAGSRIGTATFSGAGPPVSVPVVLASRLP